MPPKLKTNAILCLYLERECVFNKLLVIAVSEAPLAFQIIHSFPLSVGIIDPNNNNIWRQRCYYYYLILSSNIDSL